MADDLCEVRNQELARKIAEYEGLTCRLEEDQLSDARHARDAYLATNKVIKRNFPDRAAVHEAFTAASDAERFHESFLDIPSTELYQRIKQDDPGLVATDMRDVQKMINVLISYRSDLCARPDLELPTLKTLAQELVDLIESECPEE